MAAGIDPQSGPGAGFGRLDEIKSAAVKLFYRRGYNGTDLRLIADEIGLHPSSFYNYIDSKQQVLFLIMLDGIDPMNEGLAQALTASSSAIDALRRAIEYHTVWCAENRYLAWTQMVEIRSLQGKYRTDIIDRRDKYQAAWIELLDQGVATGEIRPVNTRLAAFAILGMLSSVARWYRPDGPTTAQQIAHTFAKMIIDGLRARPHSPEPCSSGGHAEAPSG